MVRANRVRLGILVLTLGAMLSGCSIEKMAVDNMVGYVRSLSGLVEVDDATRSAQPMFAAVCSVCHGTAGTGNQMLGAPDLTDDVWLYGSEAGDIRHTIMNGRNGVMPPHGDLLGPNRTKILAAYVLSLSTAE